MESLKSKLDSLRSRTEGGMSAQFLKIMEDATRELEASGIAERVVKVGSTLSNFELPNQQGIVRNSHELLEQGPLVLTFYRGFWCPYCNVDLAHLEIFAEEIRSAGATLLAISPGKPEFSKKIISTQKLSFDILWDRGNELANELGLRFTVCEELRDLYRNSFNINLKFYDGDDGWTLPIPARFVIDQTGTIRYVESSVDYRNRPEVDGVLETLKRI